MSDLKLQLRLGRRWTARLHLRLSLSISPDSARRPTTTTSAHPRLIRLLRAAGVLTWLTCPLTTLAIPLTGTAEPIVVAAPVLIILGLFMLIAGFSTNYPRLPWLGLSHLVICAFVFFLIAVNNWGPRPAASPVAVVGFLYSVATAYASYLGWRNPPSTKIPGVCHICGYLLRGLTTPRCPECNTPFDLAELTPTTPPPIPTA